MNKKENQNYTEEEKEAKESSQRVWERIKKEIGVDEQ